MLPWLKILWCLKDALNKKIRLRISLIALFMELQNTCERKNGFYELLA